MSNRPRHPRRGRTTPRLTAVGAFTPDELDDVCIFCRLTELVDHVHRVAIPATRDLTDEDRNRAHRLADQIQRATNALLELLAGHGPTHT